MTTRRTALVTIGVLPWGLSGCRFLLPKSDAERAQEERAETNKRLESSLTLVPYRVLKTTLRSLKVTPTPPEVVEIGKIMEGLEVHRAETDWAAQTKQLALLVAALYRARSLLKTADEDRFPLLWESLVRPQRPASWYDKEAEHLMLATVLMAVDIALNKDPLTDILAYELSRAPAQPGWPPELTLWSQAARGLLFMLAGYHYAAEEELTHYLATVPTLGDEAWKRLLAGQKSPADIPLWTLVVQTPVLLAAGYLTRAINRFELGRRGPAYDDLEAMLQQLGNAGIDNELSQWGWAMVHIHHEQYDKASEDLARLAQSPYLSPEGRAEVKRCSEQVRSLGKDKGFVLFGARRAQLLIMSALIARAGGVRNILTQLIGAESAERVYAPVVFLSAVTGQLRTGAHDALKQGEDLSNKGVQFLKEKLAK